MELASKGQLRASFLRWAVVTVPAVLLLGLAAGRLVESGDSNCWYRALAKPALNPPDWVFPVAWTSLYVLLGLALAAIFNARGSRFRGLAITLFAAQFAANLAWSPLFFGAHHVLLALADNVLMLVLAIATTLVFGRIRSVAAWLMVPYLVWISFAALLTLEIHRLNPNAAQLACSTGSTQIAL